MKNVLCKLGAIASILAASLGLGGEAIAATYNFACDSAFCGTVTDSLEFTDDGIDVTVTGFVNDDPNQARDVTQNALGLGVVGTNIGSGQVDTGFLQVPETLSLTFDHAVELVIAEFRLVNEPFLPGIDEVKVIFDGISTIFEGAITDTGGFLQGFPGVVNFTSDDSGTQVDFTVSDFDDGFRLYSLEVVKAADVTEPATLLGLVAVGAAGMITKRQSAKA